MEGKTLIRELGSCKQSNRDRAVRQILTTWLPSQTDQIPEDDMKKLWKGLFYCFWHADKSPYQSQLIDQLTSPLLQLNLDLALQYFEVFFLTMRREWSGIDHLRLDKFYLLIRRFVSEVFHLLKMRSLWGDSALLSRVMAVFLDKCFFPAADTNNNSKLFGIGVVYHLVSVFLEELRPFAPSLNAEVVNSLLDPFVKVMGRVNDKVLLGKLKTGVFDVLLRAGRKLLEVNDKSARDGVDDDDDVDAFVLGTVALKMGFADKLYGLGSAPECCQGNRKFIFGLHQEFLKLEKEFAASGVEISIPQVNNVGDGGGNGNSSLIPAYSEMMEEAGNVGDVANASADKTLKKCKSKKKASGEGDKKSKKNKKKKNADYSVLVSGDNSTQEENSIKDPENVESTDHERKADGNTLTFDETVMSNLQEQFEKVAAEAGLASDVATPCESSDIVNNGLVSKKRKRSKSMDGQRAEKGEPNGQGDAGGSVATAKSGEKSSKKVRFSMKNNLVWKPQSPLPPQSLRLPPSTTPRGSALKKGVPPGPIREMPQPAAKKVKKRRVVALRNGKKIIKSIPAKHTKKIKSIST